MKYLLNRLGNWLIYVSSESINEHPVDKAVREAFLQVGLNAEQYNTSFDLVRAGKLTDVYHIAAKILNTEPELNTVGDVIKWLKS